MKGALLFISASVHCLLYLVGTTGNVIVVFAIFRRKRLQTRINSFVVHLLVISAIRSSFVVYSKVINSFIGKKHLSSNMCNMIATIQVSFSIQTCCVLGVLSHACRRRICLRQFTRSYPKDRAILHQIGIIFVSLVLSAFGLDSYFYDDFRNTCGIQLNPQRSIFQIVLLAFQLALFIVILCMNCRVCSGSLLSKNIIHPMGIEPEKGAENTKVSATEGTPTDASSGTFRAKIDDSAGVISNGNTKSTELGSSDDSPCDIVHSNSSRGDSTFDEKISYGSTKSIDIQHKERRNSERKEGDIVYVDNLDGPISTTKRTKLQSAKYRDPTSFDSETESEASQQDQVIGFSTLPECGTILDDGNLQETSFCLEVEDLRTGQRLKTNDDGQMPDSASTDKTHYVIPNNPASYSQMNGVSNYGELHLEMNSRRVLSSVQSGPQSSVMTTDIVKMEEAAEGQTHTSFIGRFDRVVALFIRRIFGRFKKHSNKISPIQRYYEQSECSHKKEKPKSSVGEAFGSEKYGNDPVSCGIHSQADSREHANDLHRGEISVNSFNWKALHPLVPRRFDDTCINISQFLSEQESYEDISDFCSHGNKVVPVLNYSSKKRRKSSPEDRAQENIVRFTYAVAPCRGCHGSEIIVKPNSFIEQYLANGKRLKMVVFAISCSYIFLSMPLLSLELLTTLGVLKRTKTPIIIADIINDLTVCTMPLLYGCFCREFRREIFSLFVKKAQIIDSRS